MRIFKEWILRLYSEVSTIFENIIYRHKNLNSSLNNLGFHKIKLNKKLLENLKIKKKFIRNKYFTILVLEEEKIHQLIKKVFLENKLTKIISSLTGFNYKVSYLISYEIFNIPKNMQQEEIYANHWHFDKPFSKNTIKIIIPLEQIDASLGAMKVLNIENSKNIILGNSINPDVEILGDQDDLFILKPNLCAHKAGIPVEGKSRKQLMLQLNPSSQWCYSMRLFEKQFSIEPKFPLKNIFEKVHLL